MRNRDAAVRSRERKKMYVRDLEIESKYFEAECKRLGFVLQCCLAENQALRLSLHNSKAFDTSMTKQESDVLLLQLPPIFVQKYGEILPKNTQLRINSGETWNVEIERVDHETYRFNRGWTKFAVDVGLTIGEFVVFLFTATTSTFDVSLFGISGCGRGIPVDHVELIGVDSEEIEEHESSSEDEGNPQLRLLLNKHHASRLQVRKEFAMAAGLMRKKTVVLMYPPKQRRWPVSLDHRTNYPYYRLDIRRGWSEFRRANGLVFGKTYWLEYIRDNNVIEFKLAD